MYLKYIQKEYKNSFQPINWMNEKGISKAWHWKHFEMLFKTIICFEVLCQVLSRKYRYVNDFAERNGLSGYLETKSNLSKI